MRLAKKCAVIGAGIAGSLVAAKLASLGESVTVYERRPLSESGSCSANAAAMVAPYCELESSEPIIMELGLHSLELWPKLIKQYAPNTYFQRRGTIVVAHPKEQQELERFQRKVRRITRDSSRFLSSDDMEIMEPELCHAFHQGIFFAEEGQLDGNCFLRAMQKSIAEQGVSFISDCKIEKVTPYYVGNEKYDWVIDCRGMGAKNDQPQLRGVRGEILQVEAPEVTISRPIRILHPRYPIYIVPRPNGRYLIGATAIESFSEKNVTVRSALELLSTAFTAHPGFSESTVVDWKVGVRPAFRDNQPRIVVEEGCIRFNGLYRHGYLLSPIIAERLGNAIHNNLLKTNLYEESCLSALTV